MSEDRNALTPQDELSIAPPTTIQGNVFNPLWPNRTPPAAPLAPTGITPPGGTGTVSERNIAGFNYGNIKTTGGGWESYASPQEGVSAISNLIGRYQSQHGLNTIAGIIERWAPQSDPGNRGKPLIAEAAARAGLDPNTQYDFSPGTSANQALTRAIIMQEQGLSSPAARTALSLVGGQAAPVISVAQATPTRITPESYPGPQIASAGTSDTGPQGEPKLGLPSQQLPGMPQPLNAAQMMAMAFAMGARGTQFHPITYDPWKIEQMGRSNPNIGQDLRSLSSYTTRIGTKVPGPA